MYTVHIPKKELFDDKNSTFIDIPETTLQLEHSLISLRKWEQRWHKPFLSKPGAEKDDKSAEEILDYIRCMTINNVDQNAYLGLTKYQITAIFEYIRDPMTATWFNNDNRIGAQKNSSEVVTAEIIYYWMITLNIPVEFQKWHLNSLLTLIKVVNIKNQPAKKMSAKDESAYRRKIMAERRAKYHTKG